MDPTTASYYRAMLFVDREDTSPLPPTLISLHNFAFKRHQALGLGSLISKQAAFNVALTWLSSTNDGRKFARENTSLGQLFEEFPENEADPSAIDWKQVQINTPVVVSSDGSTINGTYFGRTSSWIYVMVDNKKMSFRPHQVKLSPTVGA